MTQPQDDFVTTLSKTLAGVEKQLADHYVQSHPIHNLFMTGKQLMEVQQAHQDGRLTEGGKEVAVRLIQDGWFNDVETLIKAADSLSR